MSEIEDNPEKYKVDLKETFYANYIRLAISIVGMITVLFYLNIFQRTIENFQLPEMQLIALFILAYSTTRLMNILVPDIDIVYKLRGN